MTQQPAGTVAQVNTVTGAITQFAGFVGNATGIAADPLNGHLFVSTYGSGIYEVDPVTHSVTPFILPSDAFDGLSTDGNVLDGADVSNGHIEGFSLVGPNRGQMVFDSGFIGVGGTAVPGNDGLPDGTALGFGALAGNIFANTNGGDLVEINLATHAQTIVASGGTRGDFVTVDPNNGTLLVTQTAEIDRISVKGGGFGPPSDTPEPATLTMLGMGLMGMIGYSRRKRQA